MQKWQMANGKQMRRAHKKKFHLLTRRAKAINHGQIWLELP